MYIVFTICYVIIKLIATFHFSKEPWEINTFVLYKKKEKKRKKKEWRQKKKEETKKEMDENILLFLCHLPWEIRVRVSGRELESFPSRKPARTTLTFFVNSF